MLKTHAEKFAEINSRQDALQTIFSGRVDTSSCGYKTRRTRPPFQTFSCWRAPCPTTWSAIRSGCVRSVQEGNVTVRAEAEQFATRRYARASGWWRRPSRVRGHRVYRRRPRGRVGGVRTTGLVACKDEQHAPEIGAEFGSILAQFLNYSACIMLSNLFCFS